MKNPVKIVWLSRPEDHDYTAAASFLGLLYDKKRTEGYVGKLRRAAMSEFKAKDIFRASGLPLLSVKNPHVLKDKKKILSKDKVSPILLVRDSQNGRVIIADGYHRLCAVYFYNEDALIPCQII
ncbi:MAG: hypothetical protein HQL14_04645 [Candidatus Omnitrophica bacterium]|nr:hypothetical protein [Candidatus Omnitrophota bacterium]